MINSRYTNDLYVVINLSLQNETRLNTLFSLIQCSTIYRLSNFFLAKELVLICMFFLLGIINTTFDFINSFS
jgi:hypothetical protein